MAELDTKHDRVAVISGAGTGIGQAVAAKFGVLGWRVAVGGRRVERLAETKTLVEQAGGACMACPLDVTDAGSVERFFDDVEDRFGPATVVINNAANARFGLLHEATPSDIEIEIATKLVGSLYMARRAIQKLRQEQTGGDLLFITSSSAVQPWPFHLPYSAANAGVEQAAHGLRLELEGTGIRVNVLRCGETGGTDFATREIGSDRMRAANEYWFRRGILRHTALMTPDMVADSVVAAVTLPVGYQYELMAVVPVAPLGDLPATLEEYGAAMARYLPPT